ncbi:MAG TPA: phosphoribosylanthranilate isomerase [Chryseolinea sp.]
MIRTEKIKIKVCGMRDSTNIAQVTALEPDYMGFIFYGPSPRYVGPDFKLYDVPPSAIVRVGVFVNATNDEITQLSKTVGFDHVQLHGNESVKQAGDLKDSGFTVIKVFSVDDDFDFSITNPYLSVADYFLFDTKGKFYGGNARTFSWKILNRYDQKVPFFLSGGLSPENVTDISSLEGMNLHALDVNSGVEVAPGLKDLKKLETVFGAVDKFRLKRPTL